MLKKIYIRNIVFINEMEINLSDGLHVFTGETGAGKSMVLVHLGCEALKLGKKVIHYTLELADTVVGIRYDSCLTKVDLRDIMDCKEIVKEKINEDWGKLIIKEYPTKSASTKSIKNHLEKLKKKIRVKSGDVLFLLLKILKKVKNL